jgi:hypothetical protein
MKVFAMSLVLTIAAAGAGFDVAAVKVNTSGWNGGSNGGTGGSAGRITIENTSLREVVFYAFGLPWGRDYSVSAPAWLDAEKFDIIATSPKGPSRDDVQAMMQALLVEPFGLKAHRENRELESYVLLVEKKGAKLKPNTDRAEGAFIRDDDHLTCRAITLAGLGAFDFTLHWSPDNTPGGGRAGPSIFTALQEQLGLRLQARKTTFSILVIDHMERTPAGN